MSYDSLKYIHCPDCLDELDSMPNVSPKEYARLSIGVSPLGGLVIECFRHDVIIESISNDCIADSLMIISEEECGNCGNCKCKEEGH